MYYHNKAKGSYHDTDEGADQAILTTAGKELQKNLGGMVLVTTVDVQNDILNRRSLKAATKVIKLKHMLMIPRERNMSRIYGEKTIHDSPVTTEHLSHTNQIYGNDVNRLKGDTVKLTPPQAWVNLDAVTPPTPSLYHNLTCSAVMVFNNKINLLEVIILNTRYRFIVRLLNRQVPSILKV